MTREEAIKITLEEISNLCKRRDILSIEECKERLRLIEVFCISVLHIP